MFEYTLSICCHVRTCAKFQDLLPTFVATGTGRISEDQRVEPGLGPRRTWCVVQTSSSLQPKNLHDLHENIWHNIWSTLKYHAILMEPDRFLRKLKVSQPNVALWCCLLPDVASIFHPVGCSSSCRKWMVNKQLQGANKSAARISGSADQERKHRRSHGVPNVRNLRCLWIDITSTDVYKAHVIICLEGLTYKSEQTMKNWVTWHSSRFAEWFKSTLWAPQLLHSHCPEVNEICSENPHMNLS